MNRGGQWAIVHEVTKGWTQLSEHTTSKLNSLVKTYFLLRLPHFVVSGSKVIIGPH